MSDGALSQQVSTTQLTDAEREWIRRQGMTARALAEARRKVRRRFSSTPDDVARVREQLQRTSRRFAR